MNHNAGEIAIIKRTIRSGEFFYRVGGTSIGATLVTRDMRC